MKNAKLTRILLLSAAALVLLGALLIGAALWKGENNMGKERVEQSFQVRDSFSDIQIECDACDLRLEPASDGQTSVHYRGDKRYLPTVELRNGTLYVDATDKRDLPWYLRIFDVNFFSWIDNSVTVYLPKEDLGALSIEHASGKTDLAEGLSFASLELRAASGAVTLSGSIRDRLFVDCSSGAVNLSGIRCGQAEVESSSGAVLIYDLMAEAELTIRHSSGGTTLEQVQCGSLDIDSSSGTVHLTDTLADGMLTVSSSSGGVRLDDCDAAELSLHTGSGSVKGTLRTAKIFYASAGSGSVHVPESSSGGICRVKTGSGSIDLSISD